MNSPTQRISSATAVSEVLESRNYLAANFVNFVANAEAHGVAVTDAGQRYVVGEFSARTDFNPGAGKDRLTPKDEQGDAFIAAYSASGKFQWAKKLGTVNFDRATAIATDADGNAYVLVEFNTSEFSTGGQLVVAKFDPDGNRIYIKKFSSSTEVSGGGIAVDPDGNVYLTGAFDGTFAGITSSAENDQDLFVLRLANDGDAVDFAKRIGVPDSDEEGRDLVVDSDGNVVVVGYFHREADFDPGDGETLLFGTVLERSAFFLKLTGDGDFIWARQSGENEAPVTAERVALDRGDRLVVAGTFAEIAQLGGVQLTGSDDGESDLFITRLTSDGLFGMAVRIGGTGTESVGGLAIDADRKIYLAGGFSNQVDVDPSGDEQILEVVGGTFSANAFVVKLSKTGNLGFARQLVQGITDGFASPSGSNGVDGLAVTGDNIILAGYHSATTDFKPGKGKEEHTATDNDLYLLQLNDKGKLVL